MAYFAPRTHKRIIADAHLDSQCILEVLLSRAGSCSQWLIYDAYVADQEAQRQVEDLSKQKLAARKGGAAPEAPTDATLGTDPADVVRQPLPLPPLKEFEAHRLQLKCGS